MDSIYIFVKKSDVTNAMLNRSINRDINQAPSFTTNEPWWSFAASTEFVVLEVLKETLNITTVFDNYEWFCCQSVGEKINEFLASNT